MPSKETKEKFDQTIDSALNANKHGKDSFSFLDPFGTLKAVERVGSKVFHKVTGTPSSKEKRDQQSLINEQIKAYKDQTEIAAKELAAVKEQKDVEKRRINEKQIRSLRGSYRSPGGFLNNQNLTDTTALTSKLGA